MRNFLWATLLLVLQVAPVAASAAQTDNGLHEAVAVAIAALRSDKAGGRRSIEARESVLPRSVTVAAANKLGYGVFERGSSARGGGIVYSISRARIDVDSVTLSINVFTGGHTLLKAVTVARDGTGWVVRRVRNRGVV